MQMGGWFYDPEDHLGIVHVKTQALTTDTPFQVEISATTKVKKNEIANPIVVYPNPTTGLIEVITQGNPITQVQVYDHQGKSIKNIIVKQLSDDKIAIDFKDCANGIYFLEIESLGKTITKKISLVN